MVETVGLSKTFQDPKRGSVVACDGVSFSAQPGEIVGLLGVNGAGKTTCLRMLSTVLQPSGGTATVAGHRIDAEPQRVRASIGFLSASTALYGRLTPLELLGYFGGLYGLSGSRLADRIAYVRGKLQLGEFENRLCDKLSTGQKQRVSIARAILHDPPVLFFDEPTAGLDVVTSQTVMEFIEEVRDAGKTVVFSTHIMSEAGRLCSRVAVIHDGRIRANGTVRQLKDQTGASTFESAFLTLVGYSRGDLQA